MDRYKVILSSNIVYREIELGFEADLLKIGTGVGCDLRLRKELFFTPIELILLRTGEEWSIQCSDNLYITTGGVRKLLTRKLSHGDTLEIRYQDSNNLVFMLDFLIDFNDGKTKYNRMIDISTKDIITIGAKESSDICLFGKYACHDDITLMKKSSGYVIDIKNTTYGVYHNGKKCQTGDTLTNSDFLSISDYFFYLKDGKLWTQIRTDLKINVLSYIDKKINDLYPKFYRNPRVKTVICDDKIEVLDPPEKPQKPKDNMIMRLLPSLGMLVASGVMALFGGMMIIMSAISGTMAIVTTFIGVKESNKEYKNSIKKRIDVYDTYILKKKKEIEHFRNQERKELEEIYVSQKVIEERLEAFSPDLFDRSCEDKDFLVVRLGTGEMLSCRQVEYKQQERLEASDELQQIPERLCEEYKNVYDAPIVCDLKEVDAIGIVGLPNDRFEIFKNIVLDIVARQYFSDVQLFFVADEGHKECVQWLRFLPHVYNNAIRIRNIVVNDESKNLIFEYLYKEFTVREQNKKYNSNIVFFFYDECGFKSHPISKFVKNAKDIGTTFVFFGDEKSNIPQECSYIISVKDGMNAELIDTNDAHNIKLFAYPQISMKRAKEIIKWLAPVYTEEISLESTLTKNITIFELLNILAVDDMNLGDRWKKSQVINSMSVPIGVSKSGVVFLDLHDKAHGPHGLVAGTTGSGKSEILQTYVLSVATYFHPYEIAFVIIDFKGGGMANQFRKLPHLLGAITNIDGKEINRSLKSIKAELKKRQKLFAEVEVNHIDKYIKKYKEGEAKIPLPHLVIIVDEFAELKAEQPEFMKELISAARIGRSLGVHLILATQKPSGQVNEQIWSNSRFKLCLKVQSQEDSNEVIKSPLAAEIKEPGRAYFQVGNNEIFELFQSAYSGAPEKNLDENIKEFSIYQLTESGRRVPIYTQKKKEGEENTSQLDAIVRYISEYCADISLRQLPNICMEALRSNIDFEIHSKENDTLGKYEVEIGIYDDPDNQFQGPYSVDLATNNVMIIGSAQSGKTNVIQNIIRSLATKFTPAEVSIYIVDFASMILKNFEQLHHVGGVVCPSEDEKLKNLFKLLNEEIEIRREKMMTVGVSSFIAYKEAGKVDIPLLVLIIDNLTVLKELYFSDDDELINLCREGLTVGISIVIANTQTAGIGYKYLSNFAARIAMFCNDTGEYSSLFDHCTERIDDIHGRCIVEINKEHYECQSYLAFKGEKEIERVYEIRQFVSASNEINEGQQAKRIPIIPDILTKEYIISQFSCHMNSSYSVVAGLDYETITPHIMDFASVGHLTVSGREGMGRHNWVKYSVDMLNTMYPGKSRIYVVDNLDKKLASLKERKNVVAYSMVAEDVIGYIREIEMRLQDRYDALVAGNDSILGNAELLMLIIDNRDALLSICNDAASLTAYRNIVGRYKNMRVCIVSYVDNANIPYSAPEIIKNVREQHNILYFDDINNMKLFDVPLAVSRRFKKPIEPGDGYYIKENEFSKLKTVLSLS